jgi:hypothetical protein
MGALFAVACTAGPLGEPGALDRAGSAGDDDLQQIDIDEDGIPNAEDNCPATANPDQDDLDADGVGDPCDDCPGDSDPEQGDENDNNVGDACEDSPPPEETPPPSPPDAGPLCPSGDDLCAG